MNIEYSAHIKLKCPQCGAKEVHISEIFGLYCMGCRRYYRNNQSGMLRIINGRKRG